MYNASAGRDNGIEAIQRDAPIASIEDLTLANKEEEDVKPMPPKKEEGDAGESLIIRDPYTFVGKPIVPFSDPIDIDTAVKVYTKTYNPEESIIDQLDRLANLPDAGKIDTLVIGAWEAAYDNSPDFILEKLIELKNEFKSVKHLFVGDMTYEESEISWIIQGTYTDFWQHFPDLETFGVRGGNLLKLGKIDLPKLKHIVIETGGLGADVIDDLNKSDLPNLEYLELWLGTSDYGSTVEVSHLKPILNCKFPKLTYLGLKNYYLADDMAKALKEAPTLEGLNILDISMGTMTDVGAKALYENEALLGLDHINSRHHFISNEWMDKLAEKFANQNINLDDQGLIEDDWVYVEVGE